MWKSWRASNSVYCCIVDQLKLPKSSSIERTLPSSDHKWPWADLLGPGKGASGAQDEFIWRPSQPQVPHVFWEGTRNLKGPDCIPTHSWGEFWLHLEPEMESLHIQVAQKTHSHLVMLGLSHNLFLPIQSHPASRHEVWISTASLVGPEGRKLIIIIGVYMIPHPLLINDLPQWLHAGDK